MTTPADTPVQDLIVWAAGLSSLLGFGTALWAIFSGPSRKNASRLDGLEQRVNVLEQRSGVIATKDDLHAMSMALEGIKGEMKAMRAEMNGNTNIMERLEAIVSRHDNHLLQGSGKG